MLIGSLNFNPKEIGVYNKQDANSEPVQNSLMSLIGRYVELANLLQRQLIQLAHDIEIQNKGVAALMEVANDLSAVYAGLKDDESWDWQGDPQKDNILRLAKGYAIEIENMPLEKWLEDHSKDGKIPKFLLPRIEQAFSAASRREANINTSLQTDVTQVSGASQNAWSAVSSLVTLNNRMIAAIINRISP